MDESLLHREHFVPLPRLLVWKFPPRQHQQEYERFFPLAYTHPPKRSACFRSKIVLLVSTLLKYRIRLVAGRSILEQRIEVNNVYCYQSDNFKSMLLEVIRCNCHLRINSWFKKKSKKMRMIILYISLDSSYSFHNITIYHFLSSLITE